MNNGETRLYQQLIFIFAFLFFLLSCALAFISNATGSAVTVLLFTTLLILVGSIGPSTIQELILKKDEFRITRHMPSNGEIETAISIDETIDSKSVENEPLLREAADRPPHYRSATDFLVLATNSLKTGELTNGISYITQGLELNPDDIKIKAIMLGRFGTLLTESGANKLATEQYEKALELDSNNPHLYIIFGIHLAKLGKNEEAAIAVNRAINLDPANPLAHYNLGNILEKSGKYDEAEQSYKNSIELNPYYAPPHYGLGSLYMKLNRLEVAENVFRRATELNPKDAEYRIGLGVSLANLGRDEESEQALRAAIEIDPDYALSHFNLGTLLTDIGRYDEAERSLNKALELNPEDEKIHEQISLLAKKL